MSISVQDVQEVKFSTIKAQGSELNVYQLSKHLGFEIRRLFTVHTVVDAHRGKHAHKKCRQILICLEGSCEVLLKDGMNEKRVRLNSPDMGLLIPETIWAEQFYEGRTILMVLTDMEYDESDYLRDFEQFLNHKRQS
jgi:UDP-2-acetamido-3-amino-2,3-dideoxy-glucuronate N-acetyltransferase